MLKFLKSIFICFLPTFSGIFAKPGVWYQSLVKPPLNPPSWVFGPVWTILYFSMGVALWLLNQEQDDSRAATARKVFYLQLLLNAGWTPAFFGAHRMDLALLILFCLLVSIIAVIFLFYRVRKSAGLILLPYLIWCCFAFYLNLAYYLLNQAA